VIYRCGMENDPASHSGIILSVVYRSVDSLKPFVRNARTHPKSQVEQIAASIKAFGFNNPILVDADGEIIAGHGRLLAAKALRLAEVPTITLAHLDDTQKRKLRIADNKIALNSGWDKDLLRIELGDLSLIDIGGDMTITGFSSGELDVVLNRPIDPDEQVVPAVPVNPRTKTGDIWICGEHRIGCGDGRDIAFLRKVVGDNASVDAVFIDPPYNVAISGHANVKSRHREFVMASGEMTDEAFRSFLEESFRACAAVSRSGAVHFICMDWRHLEDVAAVGRKVYDAFLNLCVWNKSNAGMGSLYRSKHELVFVYRVGKSSHTNNVELGRHGRNRTNIWDYASVNSFVGNRAEDLALHPTVKPISLVEDAIKDVTKLSDLVLDTFLGSGTTLLAAERSGRRFRGTEIDPAYVDVAIERWERLTNRKARCAKDGES
jgi:DNA modification methylase